jgi:hypothetical protein
MPWPYRAAPLLMIVGLGLGLVSEWLARVSTPPGQAGKPAVQTSEFVVQAAGAGSLLAGCVLLVQSLAMWLYALGTSRSHDLPRPLADLLSWAFRALDIQAGVYDSTVSAFSMRKIHLFGATWDLLIDPVTWCFLIGGLALLVWRARGELPGGARLRPWALTALKLLLVVALWLPLRAALLAAIYLDDVLRTDYDAPLEAMKVFWNPWLLLALTTVPVLLAWRFARYGNCKLQTANCKLQIDGPAAKAASADPAVRSPQATSHCPLSTVHCLLSSPRLRRPLAAALAMAAAALFTLGFFWDPVGQRKDGRVVFEEYVPEGEEAWEPTDTPYDTEAYGEVKRKPGVRVARHAPHTAYTFTKIYDYLGHYFNVARLTQPIDEFALEACDVLVLKSPTRPYAPEEIAAVERFVREGGSLLLIGEHTDVFKTGRHLNAVAEKFGFTFRFDCLFGIDRTFEQKYNRPLVPHPIVQYLPDPEVRQLRDGTQRYTPSLDFAISCSIAPGTSGGRAVVLGTGLKNKMADYHADNYYPQPNDVAEMRYGAFNQLLAMRVGAGRVAAFSDSTEFSSFAIMDPGKTELMMGMIEWLNHRGGANFRPWLWTAAAALLAAACWAGWGWPWAWLVMTAAGLLGWTGAALATREMHGWAMPWPAVLEGRPLKTVVMDRTVCGTKLPTNGFIAGKDDEFGIFERWILRLDYYPLRRSGADAFQGDVLVFLYPDQEVPAKFAAQLADYVQGGGKVLVVDSPENANSTANKLLEPFGLAVDPATKEGGKLKSRDRWPSIPVASAATVSGGEPLAWLGDRPVAATAAVGEGSVTVVGFGSRFSDANMGVTGDLVPSAELRSVYEVQFLLLRTIMNGIGPAQE